MNSTYLPFFGSLLFLLIFAATSVKIDSGHGYISNITAPADSMLYITQAHITDEPIGINVRRSLSMLTDSAGSISFEHVLDSKKSFAQPAVPPDTRFAEIMRSTWYRLRIKSEATDASKWYLGLHSTFTDYFIQRGDSEWKSHQIGTHRFNPSPIIDLISTPIIPIELAAGEKIDLIFRVTPGTLSSIGHDQFWRFDSLK